ncbi:MAG: DUF1730 domain-containing protein [Defluviitaleaceae bacterium]|nr:DUF1730 domain-containing protein [Defluviitaleaceae bacterium]
MVEILEKFATKHNIIAGVCHAAPLQRARLPNPLSVVPFVSNDEKKRTEPEAHLRGVKSIIVIGAGYAQSGSEQSPASAHLSSLGINDDYHVRLRGLLKELAEELKPCGDFKYKILADSPTLDERALAHRAGLGFFGRNGLIISQKFGSRFNIGCLLTTLPLPEEFSEKNFRINHFESANQPAAKVPKTSCPPDCNLCISACPTGALQRDKNGLNAARCISYLTQKNEISPQEEKLIGQQLYGCDICQNVCPFNAPAPQAMYVNPEEWLEMSDNDFERKYGHTAMMWRGTEILRRNARIVRKNICPSYCDTD